MSQKLDFVCDYDKCTGCALCASLCPQKAISMQLVDGFYRPVIGESCVGCKLCIRSCPATHAEAVRKSLEHACETACCAAWDKDEKSHFRSSSGGIASLLSRWIIENGGFVVAARFNEKTQRVEHVLIDDPTELEKNRGSKYVNSHKDTVYEQAYTRLRGKNCRALFIGVPCEVYAMRQFLKNKKAEGEMLYLDLLCRGGASPLCLDQHLKKLSKKKVENVTFRGGELDCRLAVYSPQRLQYVDYQYADPYFNLFMKHVLYQPACFHCTFAGASRGGDLTLGDFWGLEPSVLEKSKGLGCNLVLINSAAGASLFDAVKDRLEYYDRPLEEAVAGNTTLKEPTAKGEEYELFWDEVKRNGFHRAAKKVYGISFLRRYVISVLRLNAKRLMRKN